MNNLNVKNYKNYVEVVNGLFTVDKVMFEMGLDDPEEFTFRQGGIQIVPKKLSGVFNILPQYEPPQEFVPLTRQQREVERARIENERLSLQLRNMSEQELLEHFDRISQEDE